MAFFAARRRIADLRRLRAVVVPPWESIWPPSLLDLLDRLRDRGCALPRTSLGDLRAAVVALAVVAVAVVAVVVTEAQKRRALEAVIRGMRQERSARWRALLPTLWRYRPAVVYH